MSGERGERGPTGDHGQDGQPGDTGRTGATGAVGKTGATGAVPDVRRIVYGLFAFVLAAVAVLTYQFTNVITETRQDAYDECVARAVTVDRLNALYAEAILDVPDCERLRP